jgi:hypothetical protein
MKRALVLSLVGAVAATAAAAAPPSIGDLLRSVPENARAVVAVDSAALRGVPTVQEWLLHHQAWTGADQDLRQFLADAALDPIRDVDAMLVAVVPDADRTGGVALFAGHYDPGALAAALLKRGATALALDGVQAFRLNPSGGHPDQPVVLAQPSPDLVVVGEEPAVRAALAAPHAVPPLVQTELAAGHIDLRAPFWMVADVPAAVREHAAEAAEHAHGAEDEPVRGIVLASGTVQRVAAEAFLDDVLRLSGVATADTPENAELLRDAAKGVLAAARLHAQQASPELVDVLREVQVRLSGNEVSVAGAVPLPLLQRLIADHRTAHRPAPK